MKEERVQKILCAIHKIRASNLSVNTYFKRHDVPFSRVQYYTYCKIVKKYGEEGLRDKREDGNYTKVPLLGKMVNNHNVLEEYVDKVHDKTKKVTPDYVNRLASRILKDN